MAANRAPIEDALQRHAPGRALAQWLAGDRQAGGATRGRRLLDKVLPLRPEHPIASNHLALLREAHPEKGLQYAERAISLAPASAQAKDTLGWMLALGGQLERGLALLREATIAAPADPTIRYHLAEALVRAGKVGEARALLDTLLGEDVSFPDKEQARRLRGSI